MKTIMNRMESKYHASMWDHSNWIQPEHVPSIASVRNVTVVLVQHQSWSKTSEMRVWSENIRYRNDKHWLRRTRLVGTLARFECELTKPTTLLNLHAWWKTSETYRVGYTSTHQTHPFGIDQDKTSQYTYRPEATEVQQKGTTFSSSTHSRRNISERNQVHQTDC